jgi:hypothetical protein
MRRCIFIFTLAAILAVVGCKRSPALPEGPQTTVKHGPVGFTIGEIPELNAYNPDSIAWNQYVSSSEMSGPVLYLMKSGSDMSMAAPHIRLDYVSKSAPNSATVNEIFTWLINWYNSEGRVSEVVNDKEMITTADGQEVRLLEILKPEHVNTNTGNGNSVAAKRVAYAYIDNGDAYWIGICLTVSNDLRDYDSMLEKFRLLIASFEAGSPR